MAVVGEPVLPFCIQVVARAVVDDQEHLAATISPHQFLQERQECAAVEDRRELISEARPAFDRNYAENVRRLAHAERIYPGLAADPGPGLVKRPVEPEARFVAIGDDPSALARFFLIFGKVSRNQVACRARSARASRLRGRCTENRSWCSNLGT